MSRLSNIFSEKKQRVLNIYFTAGYPHLHSTVEIMQALEQNGADIIELGIPYSDPLADGPLIQESSAIAISNGMSIDKLFEQLTGFRKQIKIPVLLMGYMNPVLQYGFENFCKAASSLGIDGLILPDLPVYEFEKEYQPIVLKYDLDFIFLVTPETPGERVRKLDNLSSGFLYAVSSSSTTGGTHSTTGIKDYLQRLKNLDLKNPVMVGFGINSKESFDTVCQLAAGAIIGSAYIKVLKDSRDVNTTTKSFLSSILKG